MRRTFHTSTTSDLMRDYYQNNKALQDDVDKIISIRTKLQHVINNDLYQGSKVCLFGSSVTGFGAKDCDADMTVWFPPNSGQAGNPEDQERAQKIISKIHDHLEGLGPSSPISLELQDRMLVQAKAPVPILKCIHKRHLTSIDISVDMIGGVVTSYLQKLYSKCDDRVAPLCLIVKQWAKRRGVCNPQEGTLNSISWVLMAINFLQVHRQLNVFGPKPPSFAHMGAVSSVKKNIWQGYPRKVKDLDIDDIEAFLLEENHEINDSAVFSVYRQMMTRKRRAVLSLSELVREFFAYYGSFDFQQRIIVVRTGSVAGRKYKKMKPPYLRKGPIVIQEPIQGINTATSVREDSSALAKIRAEIVRAHSILSDSSRKWVDIMIQED